MRDIGRPPRRTVHLAATSASCRMPATSAATASRATAIAIDRETSPERRHLRIQGPGRRAVRRSTSDRERPRGRQDHAVGDDCVPPPPSAPRPRPGKTNTLLAWPTGRPGPSTTTGGKGLPVATSARPSLQAKTCLGCRLDASRSGWRAAARRVDRRPPQSTPMTWRVKVPATPVVPMSACRPDPPRSSPRARSDGHRRAPAPSAAKRGRAARTVRFVSSRSVRPSWTRPCESTSTMALDASVPVTPASRSARRNSRAMPTPAAPAPASTKRSSPVPAGPSIREAATACRRRPPPRCPGRRR